MSHLYQHVPKIQKFLDDSGINYDDVTPSNDNTQELDESCGRIFHSHLFDSDYDDQCDMKEIYDNYLSCSGWDY